MSFNYPKNPLRLKDGGKGSKEYPCSGCEKWPMMVPIYQCEKGHLLCSPCSLKKYCKPCNKKPSVVTRNVAVEFLQPELIKCDQEGCDEVFTEELDLKWHIDNTCNFIKVSLCKILELNGGNCEFKCNPGKVADAVEHLRGAHGAVGTQAKSAFNHRWLVPTAKSYETQVEPGLWYIARNDAVTVVKMFERDERKWIQVASLGHREDLHKWALTVSLTKGPIMLEFGMDCAIYTQSLHSATDQDAEICKEKRKLDVGSKKIKLSKLEVEFKLHGCAEDVKKMVFPVGAA